MDDIICHWHAMLSSEECADAGGGLHLCDMFIGEIPSQTEKSKYLLNIMTSTVPPRQTTKMQSTDIRQAKVGKDQIVVTHQRQRRIKRKKALDNVQAPMLETTALDLMDIADDVQTAIGADAEENDGVLKAFRMGGYGAYGMDKDGRIVHAVGGIWDNVPLQNNRIDKETWSLRLMTINYSIFKCSALSVLNPGSAMRQIPGSQRSNRGIK